MQEKTELKIMFWFTIIYLTIFTLLAIFKKNYEFLYYTFVLSALILIIILYHKKLHLTNHIIAGLIILGILHILGGNIHILNTRLYDLWLIPPNILKYDNFVHTFGGFIATIVSYSFIRPHLDNKIKNNYLLTFIIITSIAMGIGAFNEIIELCAVLFFEATKQVGDYMNNALDLVFNLLGSIIACMYILKYHMRGK